MDKFLNRRARSSSLTTVEDIVKRKRQEEVEEINNEEETFRKSKKTTRSPVKRSHTDQEVLKQEDMDIVLRKLEEMSNQMTKIEERRVEDTKTIREEISKYNQELKEELAKREVQWQKEKEELKKQITTLETKIEVIENKQKVTEEKERRKNVIVKIQLSNNERKDKIELKKCMEKLYKDKLEVDVTVTEVVHIVETKNGDIVKVVMASRQDKIEIMKNKHKLRGKNIFVDDDLTKEERSMQKEIRDRAKQEKNCGKQTKIGFGKLMIDGKWISWKELSGNKE